MFAGQTYLASLSELAEQSATGEFIAVSNELEVHVFFQLGRVAWGTTSIHRYAFSRHLFQHCNVDKEVFKELVETCRTEHKPLGETLVAWGLVTQEQVRDALAQQLMETLQCLAVLSDAQTLFLPRDSFADYDAQLTFAVDDIFDKVGLALDLPTEQEAAGDRCDPLDMFERFKADVPDSLWMEVLSANTISVVPETHANHVGCILDPIFLDCGADFVAIRTQAGTIVGGMLSGDGESLWIGLGRNAVMGNALSALAPLLSARLAATDAHSKYEGDSWLISGDDEHILGRVRAAIEHTDAVLAAFSLSDDGELLWACARKNLPLGDLASSAQQWSAALELPIVEAALTAGRSGQTSSIRYASRSLVAAHAEMWTFGCGYRDGARGGLWLCVDRSTSQGLGWAILTSLARFVCPKEVSA